MRKEWDTRNGQGRQPDLDRRKLGMGLLAVLDGGVLGAVDVTIDDPNIRLSLRVGGNTYNLFDGRLVLEGSVPA